MKKIKSFIVIITIVIVPVIVVSQPDPQHNGNGSGVGNTPVGGPSSGPIDGGSGILLALGLVYAVKSAFRIKKG